MKLEIMAEKRVYSHAHCLTYYCLRMKWCQNAPIHSYRSICNGNYLSYYAIKQHV